MNGKAIAKWISSGKQVSSKTAGGETPAPPPPAEVVDNTVVEVFQKRKTDGSDYLLTLQQDEAEGMYVLENKFFAYKSPGPNRNPVHRCRQNTSGKHFFSLDQNCEGHGNEIPNNQPIFFLSAKTDTSRAEDARYRCRIGESHMLATGIECQGKGGTIEGTDVFSWVVPK